MSALYPVPSQQSHDAAAWSQGRGAPEHPAQATDICAVRAPELQQSILFEDGGATVSGVECDSEA